MFKNAKDFTYISKYYISDKWLKVIETNYLLGTQKEYLEKVGDK